LATGYM